MSSQPSAKPPWQPRFGLGSMMLVILVCAMTAAAGRYFVLAISSGASSRVLFVLFVLVLPMVLVVTLNAIRLTLIWLHRARRKR